MTQTIIAPIIVFAVIVIVHEFGHFITAKLTGMKVEEFAVGFGPVIWSKKKGETLYSFRLLPLGGFNKIMGMDNEPTDDVRAFSNRSVWKRLIVISAGAICNILLAFFIFTGTSWYSGIETFTNEPIIGRVVANSPAEKAGIEAGDVLLSIDGKKINQWMDVQGAIKGYSHSVVEITVGRQEQHKEVSVIPDDYNGQAVIGIVAHTTKESITLLEAVKLGFIKCARVLFAVAKGFWTIFNHIDSAEVAGPIGVAKLAGDVADNGILPFLLFIAILSLNLGFWNLLPIPLLDGGLIALTILEAICRRKLSNQVLFYIQCTGIFILGGLFLYSTVNDITALFK